MTIVLRRVRSVCGRGPPRLPAAPTRARRRRRRARRLRGRAHGGARRCGHRWNINASTAIFAAGPDRARFDAELRDGPWRRLRRRQRNRRQPSAVSRHAARRSGDSKGGRCRDRRVPRSRRRCSVLSDGRAGDPAAQYDAALAASRGRREDAAGSPPAKRPPPRCSPRERTTAAIPRHAVPVRVRHRRGRLARVAAAHGARPDTLGRQRASRSSSRTPRCSAPRARTSSRARATPGLQRGQGARLVLEHDAHRRSDERRHLLAIAAARALRRRHALVVGPLRFDHGRRTRACSPWRASPPPTARSAAGTTSTTGTSGVRSTRSDWRRPTATRRPRPTRLAAALRPGDGDDARRWRRRTSPTTRRGTAASAARC